MFIQLFLCSINKVSCCFKSPVEAEIPASRSWISWQMGESQMVLVKAKWRTKGLVLEVAINPYVLCGLACNQVARKFWLEIDFTRSGPWLPRGGSGATQAICILYTYSDILILPLIYKRWWYTYRFIYTCRQVSQSKWSSERIHLLCKKKPVGNDT